MVLARRVHFKPLVSSFLEVPGILGRLAEVKLERESSSREPSLRRCLGHSGVFRKCLTAAEEEAAQPVAAKPKKESYPEPPKANRSETHPVRAQVFDTIKSVITRRPASQPLLDNPAENDLTRVQARGPATSSASSAPPRHNALLKIPSAYRTFIRLRHKIYDKSLG